MTILGRLDKKQIKARAIDLLTSVGLQDRLSHLPSELSGGEQQRVTIARALSNEPDLLLLDEPTGDLDTRNTIEIMDLLLSVNLTHGTTCIMVTHNPDLECYADRILYVEDGRFKKQALNQYQSRLDFDHYMAYITTMQHLHPTAPKPTGNHEHKTEEEAATSLSDSTYASAASASSASHPVPSSSTPSSLSIPSSLPAETPSPSP